MNYDAIEADQQAMRVIELLIESGHYKGFHKDEVIKAIARDANSLSAAFTLKSAEMALPQDGFEGSDAAPEIDFPQCWTKAVEAERV
ncbi:MAG TPA: hypothetical protein VGN01_15725 [Acidobacteriaceae bacterium]|jgi:hypothetical protein